jgi:predicted nucleic acid-binding protein
MRCLVDTNVLVRGMSHHHPDYRIVRQAIITLRRQNNQLLLAFQNLIEFWAVATRPVNSNGLGMSVLWAAEQLVRIKRFFPILIETADICGEWERLVSQFQVSGKNAHDARIVAAMNVHSVTHIITFNSGDFIRFPGIQVIHPRSVAAP